MHACNWLDPIDILYRWCKQKKGVIPTHIPVELADSHAGNQPDSYSRGSDMDNRAYEAVDNCAYEAVDNRAYEAVDNHAYEAVDNRAYEALIGKTSL